MKKFLFLPALLGVILLAGCGAKTPEISFDEAYQTFVEQDLAQNKELLSFIEGLDGKIIEQDVSLSSSKEVGGKVVSEDIQFLINMLTHSDMSDASADGNVTWSLALSKSLMGTGGVDMSTSGGLSFVASSGDVYFKLDGVSVESSQPEISMMNMFLSQLGGNWIKIPMASGAMGALTPSTFSLKDLLSSDFVQLSNSLYGEGEATTYNGYPAYSLTFNEEAYEELLGQVFDFMLGDETYQLMKQQLQADGTGSFMTVSDFEGYLVILDDGSIELDVKNMTFHVGDQGTFTLSYSQSPEKLVMNLVMEPLEAGNPEMTLSLLVNKTADNVYSLDISVAEGTKTLISATGNVNLNISTDLLEIHGNLQVSFGDGELLPQMNIPVSYTIKLSPLDSWTFEIPAESISLEEALTSLFGGLMGGMDPAAIEAMNAQLADNTSLPL